MPSDAMWSGIAVAGILFGVLFLLVVASVLAFVFLKFLVALCIIIPVWVIAIFIFRAVFLGSWGW